MDTDWGTLMERRWALIWDREVLPQKGPEIASARSIGFRLPVMNRLVILLRARGRGNARRGVGGAGLRMITRSAVYFSACAAGNGGRITTGANRAAKCASIACA